jgi:uncharacterized protein
VAGLGCASERSASGPNVHREYFSESQLKLEVPLDASGEPAGLARAWHPNGQLHWTAEMREGQRHGEVRSWYEHGQPESERRYENGLAHGPFTDWHPNGRVAARGTYVQGEIVEIEEWDEAGERIDAAAAQ